MRTYKSRLETNAVQRYDGLIIGPEHKEEWCEYQAWLAEGNKPSDPDPLPEPVELTPKQKLENAGLTVEELKQLLGL